MYVALVSLMLAVSPVEPDTLVVCPAEFREALEPWLEYRRNQGHQILVVKSAASPEKLQAEVRRVAKAGGLKCLVLIGDVADGPVVELTRANCCVPTYYVAAKVNTRWGSKSTIATDIPYADVDGDNSPDLMVGRIPADSPEELSCVVRKVIRYEQESRDGAWQRRLDLVAGVGGFGTVANSLIEAAGRQVFLQAVPKGYEMRHTSVKDARLKSGDVCATVRGHLSEGSLAWIYMGHGQPTELDRISTGAGDVPLLSVNDVAQLQCVQQSPLAVLVACYTGAFDARQECLAEELALAEKGPVAVIAATRVTMPYGNTVIGYELLRACFHDRPTSLGEILRLAQCRALEPLQDDTMRPSLDSLALGLSSPPVDLMAERREHVLMYHLFGDPLLRLRLSQADAAPAATITTPVIGAAISK